MGLLRLAQETPQVSPDTSVMAAVRVMTAAGVGAIAVTTGGKSDGKIMGVFTERDLMQRVVHEGRSSDSTLIREVMTTPVRTVPDATSVSEAAALMRRHQFRHLAIVDANGAYLGMVALRHLLYDLMDDLERKVGGLESFVMIDGPGG
ncbi:MAG: CBS domain-containing protein [Polyangia bacterium]